MKCGKSVIIARKRALRFWCRGRGLFRIFFLRPHFNSKRVPFMAAGNPRSKNRTPLSIRARYFSTSENQKRAHSPPREATPQGIGPAPPMASGLAFCLAIFSKHHFFEHRLFNDREEHRHHPPILLGFPLFLPYRLFIFELRIKFFKRNPFLLREAPPPPTHPQAKQQKEKSKRMISATKTKRQCHAAPIRRKESKPFPSQQMK